MAVSAAEMQALIDKLVVNMGRWDQITNAGSAVSVTVDSGIVPSLMKFFANFALTNGSLIYTTRANLYGNLTPGAWSGAWVTQDPTADYNGIYRKNGATGTGSWTKVLDLPYFQPSDEDINGIQVDKFGLYLDPPVFGDENGTVYLGLEELIPGDEDFPGQKVDKFGLYFDPEVTASSGSGASGNWTNAYKLAQDGVAGGYSASIDARPVPAMAGMYWDHFLILEFGQSLAVGGVGHPTKTSSVPSLGVTAKMYGASTLSGKNQNTFYPFSGVNSLQPLVAKLQQADSGGGTIYDESTYVIEVNAGMSGEVTGIGTSYSIMRSLNDSRQELTGNFQNREPILGIQGYGGTELEILLSYSNMPGYSFSARARCDSYMSSVRTLVQALPKTIGFGLAIFNQGQANYNTPYADYYGYLGDYKTMIDGYTNDYGHASRPTPIFMHQTTDHWVDAKIDKVPQAQHAFALANPTVFISTPNYAVPEKMDTTEGVGGPPISGLPTSVNGHKDGNGYRWLGSYDAKLWKRLFIDKRYWEHMHIVQGTWNAVTAEVLLSWHCPVTPIVARECFEGYRRVMYDDLGVAFLFGGTQINTASYQIVGNQSILFKLESSPTSGLLGQAIPGHATGKTNISDSDPSVSYFNYVDSPQDYAARDPNPANITANEVLIKADVDANLSYLYGKPYPLPNRCALEVFNLTEVF